MIFRNKQDKINLANGLNNLGNKMKMDLVTKSFKDNSIDREKPLNGLRENFPGNLIIVKTKNI